MMSLGLVAFALFQSVYIPELQRILETTDWRQVWIMLGAAIALTILPLMLFLMRDKPEDFGLQPDGDLPPENDDNTRKALPIEENWSLREVMQTALFWIFILGRVLPPAFGTGLILHQVSLFESLGYGAGVAAETYSLFALLSAGFALAGGVIVDRFRANHVMILQMAALILTLFMATVMTQSWMLPIYAGAFGLVMGMGGVFDGAVWANLFGRLHLGSIRGFVATTVVAGTAAGPILFGISYDTLGSYTPVLWLGMALTAVPLVLSLFVDKPRRKAGA
jgi:sugar phosphate permease